MATHPATASGVFRFGGDFELDVPAYELRSAGIPLKLKPIPLELLIFLVARRGELVTREQIVERIWGKGVFLDTDNSINGAISRIRQLLRDDAAQPRYIQTVTGRGYRFIAAVTESLPPPTLAVDEPLAAIEGLIGRKVSHYRILELLGGGGMGVVYKAEDLKLGRRVAIKFLPTELATDPESLGRLESEARAASALDHRNICSIYELGEHEGQPFIVMQLLEGQTLQEQMEAAAQQGTTLSLNKALAIAVHVAEGLHAAHEKGFIHRDIKPANILIAGNDEAKILDFGLAKSLEEDVEERPDDSAPDNAASSAASALRLRLTVTGTHMGTAFYMSPEQVRGEKLDARTDIFSFGLVLYQMLSGQRAFAGNTTPVVHDGILHNDPPPLKGINPALPSKLVAVVDKCLAKDRSQRFQKISEPCSILKKVIGESKSRESYLYRYKWHLAALVILVLGGAGLLYRVKHHPRHLSDTDTLVISDFINTTGDAVFDGTLKEAVSIQLQQTPSLHVMPDKQVIDTLRMMNHQGGDRLSEETGREVCLRSNGTGLVSGSVAPVANGYDLRVTVKDCHTGDILASAAAKAKDRSDVIRVLGQAVSRIRGALGESLASLEKFNTPLDEATTSSLEALQAYSQGRYEEFHSGPASAVPYYNLAVQLDPGFALAYAALAQSYYNLRYRDQADVTFAKAFELRNRTTRHEKLRIETQYYLNDVDNLNEALVPLTEWETDFPSDFYVHQVLSSLYRSTGHYEEALEEAKRSLALAPDNTGSYFAIVLSYVRLNDAAEAVAAYHSARSKNLDTGNLRFVGYLALFLKGDMAGLEQEVKAAKGNKNAEDSILFAWGCTQAYFGREQAAVTTFHRAIELAQSEGGPERAGMWAAEMALDEAEIGRPAVAQEMARESLSISNGRAVQTKSAFVLALAGKTSQAAAIADRLNKQRPHDTMVQQFTGPMILAAAALQQKKWRRAVEMLQPALEYEMGGDAICCLWSAYIRGKAYLDGNRPKEAASEFQKVIDHPGTVNVAITGPLAHLQLARAQVMMGDRQAARKSYQDFLATWKDADPDIPIYRQAKAEYANLR